MSEEIEVRLTTFSKGAGCGCKIAPAVLREILRTDDVFPPDPRLIVGNESNDDASVIDIGDGRCLISTTDFFMPVVDDAYTFGKIAAANALSDIYAMGGAPLTALAILGWPVDKILPAMAARVLDGARFTCRIAGITLAGGHSIESAEPIFGMAVNGIMPVAHVKKNNTAKEGDLLFLSKPLGMGIMTTAAKRGMCSDDHYQDFIAYMCDLNKIGAELGGWEGVHAMTDVTGFGLAGHLMEMCEGSGLSAEVELSKVPVLPYLHEYTSKFIYPDMTMKNFQYYSSKMNELNASQLFVACDPQTSGGLLVAVSPDVAGGFVSLAANYGLSGMVKEPIGRLTARNEKVVKFL